MATDHNVSTDTTILTTITTTEINRMREVAGRTSKRERERGGRENKRESVSQRARSRDSARARESAKARESASQREGEKRIHCAWSL